MRVLMTTDTVGGVWTFTRELSEELLRRGHTISLLSFGRIPNDIQSSWALALTSAYLEQFEFHASLAPLEWSQENARSMSDGEPALVATVKRFKPDVVLCSQFCFGASDVSVPCIVVAHSDVLSWARACNLTALTPTPWLEQYKRLVQSGLQAAAAIAAPTRAVLDGLAMDFIRPPVQSVIANGRLLPAIVDVPNRQLQAVSAGRLWDKAKGLDLLCAGELPLPVLLAGETQFEEASELCEWPENVRSLGYLSPEKLHALFHESAIYLCTSRYEPFGLAPLEAALCGCAIVARDLPSLREVWGDDALYFHDTAGLTEQVRALTRDDTLRSRMSQQAQARAKTYTVAKMADGYLALFQTVLGEGVQTHVA